MEDTEIKYKFYALAKVSITQQRLACTIFLEVQIFLVFQLLPLL